ncbi:MAG: hypothetical protein IJY09_05675 [Lachnospiraceae bacterium]|nr:hypothetical protein [Lachnospiraceae bacterium]
MDNTLLDLLEQNISLLEKGISLDEYIEKEMQLKIDGDTAIYNKYGFFVIYNKTKNRYLLEGGNNLSGYTMSITIPQYFIYENGYGNPYMYKDYADGDMLVLIFWRYDSDKYDTMDQFKEYIENYYDSIGETYFDYIMRLRDKSYNKGKRPKGYNAYYNGKKTRQVSEDFINQSSRKKIMAERLLRLENKSVFLYNLLNAITDLLVKPIPIFIWGLIDNSSSTYIGLNAIKKSLLFVFWIIGSYLGAIAVYLFLLFFIQIFKLFLCTYKPLVIHFRIFDVIIRLSTRKILKMNDEEIIRLLDKHEDIIESRKEKRNNNKSRVYARKRERDLQEYAFIQQEYERAKESAKNNRDSAERNFEKAREGGTLFSSAEAKREEGKRDMQRATYDEQDAKYYEERIHEKERVLGIKKKNNP